MALRSPQERVFQSVIYEAGGWLMAVPLFVMVTGGSVGEGALLMVTLTAVVILWLPVHNTLFDRADLYLSGRVASERPHGWRMVHAISQETSSVLVTAPVLVWLGGFSPWQALLADLALTVIYAVYAYGFHLVYDRLRPIHPRVSGLVAS
jgi:uncharacterized membrane protein